LSFWDIEPPEDWFRKRFGAGPDYDRRFSRRGRRRGWFGSDDIFRYFDEMTREMEREFEEELGDIQTTNASEKSIREEYYDETTPPREKVKKSGGPFVYGYSMTIGPDGNQE
jgi:HSP20 family protein